MYPYGQQPQDPNQYPQYPGMPMPGQQMGQMPYPGQQGGYGMPQPGAYPMPGQPMGQPYGQPPQQMPYGQQPQGGFGMGQQMGQQMPYGQPPQQMPYGQQAQGGFGAQQTAYPQAGQMPGMNQQMPPNMGYPNQQMPPTDQGYGQQYAPQHGYAPPQGHQAPVRKGNPTVTPSPNFNAMNDAGILRKAMKGFGTDEDALISVICRRTNAERQQIAKAFKTSYGKELISDIKSETKNNFEKLLVSCLIPTMDYYCMEINEALVGVGTDEEVLIEVMCTLSNKEISDINFNYQRMYGSTLESALMSDSSGTFKRLLVSLCAGGRDESNYTDVAAAKVDAAELLRAGENRIGTDESTFNRILCSRNFEQLKLVCQEYQNLTGHSLEKAIKGEFSGDIEDGLKAIVRCVNSKADFFAKQLYNAMAGLGTNDAQLIRICVTRCEIDMQDIKAAFQQKYGKTVKSFIKGDSSGDYKHGLYALIGESR